MSFKAGCVFVCTLLVASVQSGIVGRIIGGQEAKEGQFPYQVSLRLTEEHICGASIISERFILTAAHCVVDENMRPYPAKYFSIQAGSINRLSGGVVVEVKKITINENYDGDAVSDIALLELEKPLTYSATIRPIELETEEVPIGAEVLISGWGVRTSGSENNPTELRFNTLKTITKEQCFSLLGLFSDQLQCLGHRANNGACSGDSGGPAAYNGKLIGVAGFVWPSCGTRNPDGFAKVSFHTDWIKSVMA